MKSYELQPTPENLLKTFLRDSISRNIDIFRFIDILNAIDDFCSIAVDGNWGCGKTFFVKQVKMIIDSHNKFINNENEDVRQKIVHKNAQYRPVEKMEYIPQVCIYYDAWENDNDEDPMLSLVYNIMQSVDVDYSLKECSDCLQLGASVLEFFSGRNYREIIDSLRGENPLETIKKGKNIHQATKNFLESIMNERGNRLVIIIDELDRCRPEYAVKLLERVKHYFDNDRITFVFSTNLKELQHTIRRYYGNDFNASKYLDRFFDLRVTLPKADYRKFYALMDFDNTQYKYDIVCSAVIEAYHFELREVAKYLRQTKIAAYKPTHGNSYDFAFAEELGMQFSFIFIAPIMIGMKIYDIDVYEDLIYGRDCGPLLKVSEFLREGFFNGLLKNDETFYSPNEKQTQVSVEEKIKELYDAIFVKQYDRTNYEISLGKYIFNKDTKEELLRVVGLLSKYTYIEND